MAEYQIDSDADVFLIDLSTPHPWICRDDDGDYWTIYKNLSGNIDIHKSEDDGVTWVQKKELTDSDFTGTPFPIDGFQIINLEGQNKIYILISKVDLVYGWVINTLTDAGSIDLDADSLSMATVSRIEIRWDNANTKLKIGYGRTDDELIYLKTINLAGGFSDEQGSDTKYGGNRGYGFCIDSIGNVFFNGMATSGGSSNLIKKFGVLDNKELGISNQVYDFANLVCDHSDKIILGCVYSNALHIFKASNDLSTLEINNANYALGFTPSSCFLSVDGFNKIYFVYTKPADNEAYSIKYDIGTSSWDSPIKISSDNDGILIIPELRPPVSSTKLLVTYQSTS